MPDEYTNKRTKDDIQDIVQLFHTFTLLCQIGLSDPFRVVGYKRFFPLKREGSFGYSFHRSFIRTKQCFHPDR